MPHLRYRIMHAAISFTDTCRGKVEVQSQVQVIYYQNPIACCTLIISSIEYKYLSLLSVMEKSEQIFLIALTYQKLHTPDGCKRACGLSK